MKKKGTRRTYTKQITHPYISVSRKWFALFGIGSERQDLLQNEKH